MRGQRWLCSLQSRRRSAMERGLHARPRPASLSPAMDEGTTHRLADGTLVRTRPLRPDDREKLRNGFARLSPESKYRRFFSAPATLSEASLDYLTTTDGRDHVAIGAELARRGGRHELRHRDRPLRPPAGGPGDGRGGGGRDRRDAAPRGRAPAAPRAHQGGARARRDHLRLPRAAGERAGEVAAARPRRARPRRTSRTAC